MLSKTKKEKREEVVRARLEPSLKKEVEKILNELGLTSSEAIYIFFKMIKQQKGIPFEVKIPNRETIEAIEAAVNEQVSEYDSVEDMLEDSKNW